MQQPTHTKSGYFVTASIIRQQAVRAERNEVDERPPLAHAVSEKRRCVRRAAISVQQDLVSVRPGEQRCGLIEASNKRKGPLSATKMVKKWAFLSGREDLNLRPLQTENSVILYTGSAPPHVSGWGLAQRTHCNRRMKATWNIEYSSCKRFMISP